MGVKLLGGLPDDDGLSPADEILKKNPTREILAVVRLSSPGYEHSNETGNDTHKLRILEVEMAVADGHEDDLRRILDRERTRRLGHRQPELSEGIAGDDDAPQPDLRPVADIPLDGDPAPQPAPAKAGRRRKAE